MTSVQIQTKIDQVLARCDVVRASKGDRSVEYAEAQKVVDLLRQEKAVAVASEGSTTRIRQTRMYSEKGL
jgi:outer membrane cobalamin receptor